MANTAYVAFTPSGSLVTFTPGNDPPARVGMPAVDSGNPDLQIVNNGSADVWISFAANPVWLAYPANNTTNANAGDNLIVGRGQTLLLTSNYRILGAAPGLSGLSDYKAGVYSTAGSFAACSPGFVGTVKVQRGTLSLVPL